MQPVTLNRLIFFLLCCILIWAPIPLGSNRPWSWALLELLIGAAFLLHLLQCWRTPQFELLQRRYWLAVTPLLLLTLWLALQSFSPWPLLASVDPYQTQVMLVKTTFFVFWFILLLSYAQGHKRLRLLALAIVIAGALQAFYGVVLQLSGQEFSPVIGMDENQKARGSFVYQNHFANYLALALSVAMGLLLSQLSSRRRHRDWRQLGREVLSSILSAKVMLRLAMVLMVVGLVMSRSRMGNAAFFTALIVTALTALWFYKRPPALLKPLVISILLLDMVLIGSMFGLVKLQQRYQDTSFATEARDNVVIDSIPLLQQHFWTGSGGGSFYTVFPAVQPEAYSGFYDHAHNDYLQFAIELGVPLTVMLLLWLLYLGWTALQVMRLNEDKLLRGLCFGCLMALCHMALHCTVDFNLQAPANALLFLSILAIVVVAGHSPGSARVPRSAH
jgi:O-antigen ligase